MLYSGDDLYDDEITSPLYRPMPTYVPTRRPRRVLVKQARKAIAAARPDVYEEYADLYEDDPSCYSNDAEDRYNRGGW